VTDSLWQLSLVDFRDRVASDAPTPSCGAAAGVSASLGLSLILKAIRIGSDPADKDSRRHLNQGATIHQQLATHADTDARVFQHFLKAEAPEIKGQAARDSVAIPLATAHSCREAMRLGERAAPYVKKAMRPDVVAGVLLLGAALEAVLLNVRANLAQVDDDTERRTLAERCRTLQADADQIRSGLTTDESGQ
jgi:formiminotetrahydrofolate cyclodeaminase